MQLPNDFNKNRYDGKTSSTYVSTDHNPVTEWIRPLKMNREVSSVCVCVCVCVRERERESALNAVVAADP
jgi:hypothetical protein